MLAIEPLAGAQHGRVRGGVGADDHLGALAGRCEAALFGLGLDDALGHLAHGGVDRAAVLFRRQGLQRRRARQLDVDRQPVGPKPRLFDQPGTGLRDGLQVDIAGEAMVQPEGSGHPHHGLHGVVRGLGDPGGEEQSLDVIALVEAQRQVDDLLDLEARPRDVGRAPVHAIGAVEKAVVGQQDLEQRHAAAIGRVGMADAGSRGRAYPIFSGAPALGSRRRAGGVILGCIGEDAQFTPDTLVHVFMICSEAESMQARP